MTDDVVRAINEGENHYRQTVLGQKPLPGHPKVDPTAGKVIDLMAALADALAPTKTKPPTSPATGKSRPAPSPDLSAELERLAAADRAPETEPGKTP